ncbi:MAG: nucleotide exchange factor GrpE [Clostridia bacterium]|nr:nucleotide exchange factor GrpE [Clostridia bacterium]
MAEEIKKEEAACAEEKAKKKPAEKKDDKKLKSELDKALRELEEKKKELDEQNDRYMRMIAEYDNYRKRTAKEKESIYTDAYFDALSSILPIIDNVERAASYTDGEKVAEGVALILKSFNEVLEKMSVTAYGETGDEFDPNIHNAMMHVEREDLGENVIADVFQKGYKKGDRVLRHAMVTVAN